MMPSGVWRPDRIHLQAPPAGRPGISISFSAIRRPLFALDQTAEQFRHRLECLGFGMAFSKSAVSLRRRPE
jgi:hypothetical protein